MTYATPAQRRVREELLRARGQVVAFLTAKVGPALDAATAQLLVEQAKGWGPKPVRDLAQHFHDHPNALTAPTRDSPVALVRLLHLLDAAGHHEAVAKLACALCGRTNPLPLEQSELGRCCGWCLARTRFRTCARCGGVDQIVTRLGDGPICRHCYRKDPLVVEECARCHHVRAPASRGPDGRALCCTCTPRPLQQCSGCGRSKKVNAHTPEGPVCGACYESPARLCGLCGKIRPIQARATDDQPDICVDCYRGPIGQCSICGRLRHGGNVSQRGGAFHCRSCWPRPVRECAICHKPGRTQAVWPLGPVCNHCYQHRRKTPQPCSACANSRIIIGTMPDGGGLCAACCGRDNPAARCRTCHTPGDLTEAGLCPRCALADRVRDLLSTEDGVIPAQLVPLTEVLTGAANPYPVLTWLHRSRAARILADLAEEPAEITHSLLDGLPQNSPTRHVRGLLVAAGVLPRRNEHLAHLERWIAHSMPGLPPHQTTIIRPFAEWCILRDARRRAARDRYSLSASKSDIQEIRTTITFLAWLDDNGLVLGSTTQADFEVWLTAHPTLRKPLTSFIHWATSRRLTTALTLPPRPRTFAGTFLNEDQYTHQLRRCLNDDSLPPEVRIIGALTLLYALSLNRITELTTDRYHCDAQGAFLTLGQHPVLLPPRLARLIEEQITDPNARLFRRQLDDGTHYLLPGQAPGRPRNPLGAGNLMRLHGLPVRPARNTAVIEAVTDMPPTVVADLFGLYPDTATRWATYANDNWAHYLAARPPHD
ncbi:XRE family transcriptional regulator [Streptomyces sp. NPDC091371]|uniref:XRE family transcriptional regulator n=1 Tax=Streptomyces sp. NPDC091371 TaxID=3155303 RepID=UPI00341C2C1B